MISKSAPLDKAPIRASLTRPRLLLGADRNWALAVIFIAAFFFIGERPWWSYVLGLSFALICLPLLRKAANTDPMLIPIWKKFLYRPDYSTATKHFLAPYRVFKRKNKRD